MQINFNVLIPLLPLEKEVKEQESKIECVLIGIIGVSIHFLSLIKNNGFLKLLV